MKYLEAATGGGTAATLRTRSEKLLSAAAIFQEQRHTLFRTFYNIENRTIESLDNSPIAGTVLEPMARQMQASGHPGEPTFSDVMREFELDRAQMNELACYCHNGERVNGGAIGQHLSILAGNREPVPQDTGRFRYLTDTD